MVSYHTSPYEHLGSSAAGGMNLYVRSIARGLARRGIAVDVYTRRAAVTQEIIEPDPGVPVVALSDGLDRAAAKSELAVQVERFAQAAFHFAQARAIDYDLIHAHYWLSVAAGRALRTRHQPVVQMFHTLTRVKAMYGHCGETDDLPGRDAVEAAALASDATTIFASRTEISDVRAAYGVTLKSAAVIPPGVDATLFKPGNKQAARQQLGMGQEKIILCVGRMDPCKGVDALLQAAAVARKRYATPFRIVIAGGDADGDDQIAAHEMQRLRSLAATLTIEDIVQFCGAISHDDIANYYAACDLCAVPSDYESFGIAALEALSSGRPVVGFRSPGLEQTVSDGANGFLVPAGDTEKFAEAMQRVISDEAVMQRLGGAARESARDYSWEAATEKTIGLYESLLGESAAVA